MDDNGSFEKRMAFFATQLERARSESSQLKRVLNTKETTIRGLRLKPCKTCFAMKQQNPGGSKNSLEIFPEEVWEILFGYLSDPMDLSRCYNVAEIWRTILAPRRSIFYFNEVLPLIFDWLGKSDIFNCRQVCRPWRNAIDAHLEQNPTHFSVEPETGVTATMLLPAIHLRSADHIDSFMQNVQRLGNPMLFRTVHCKMEPAVLTLDVIGDYWLNVERVLNTVGRDIWHCRLALDGFPPNTMHDKLRESLLLLPHLKSLWVSLGGTQFFSDPDEFIEYMKRHPLPELKHLVKLQVVNVPHAMTNVLLKTYSGTLKRLEVCAPRADDFDYSENTVMTKLSEFSVTDDDLVKFSSLQWPLEKLKLSFNRKHFTFAEVFEVVNKFGSTLREVYLNLDYFPGDTFNGEENWLSLPLVQKLTILWAYKGHSVSIDYLLALTSLRELHIEYRNCIEETESKTEIVKVSGYWHRLYESNIWRLFPSLKSVHVKYAVKSEGGNQRKEYYYTRSSYNRRCNDSSHEGNLVLATI